MTTTPGTTIAPVTVTVLGLGEMGSALANAFVSNGHPTTVWNRTPGKADALVRAGARAVSEPGQAVAAGELVVVSVQGNDIAREILESAGEALAGRTVLNLTDGTSTAAREVAERAAAQGADYLHGQIMTIAPGIGQPESVVFYGGSETAYGRYGSALTPLAGRGAWISADPGMPALYGMAVHGTMWGLLNGFLHAAALLSDAGVGVRQFLSHAEPSMSALTSFLPFLADEVDSGEFAVPFGALKHHLPSIEDLVRESEFRGIDAELPRYTRALVTKLVEAGHGNDSYSRVVEHFRKG